MTKRYYNTTEAQIKVIKEMVQLSNNYEQFRIKFESPIGDVLYLKRVGNKKFERYMPISNLFALSRHYKCFQL